MVNGRKIKIILPKEIREKQEEILKVILLPSLKIQKK